MQPMLGITMVSFLNISTYCLSPGLKILYNPYNKFARIYFNYHVRYNLLSGNTNVPGVSKLFKLFSLPLLPSPFIILVGIGSNML